MSKFRLSQIEYDGKQHGLPKEFIVELDSNLDAAEMQEAASEHISRQTGFCQYGFSMELID
jgi:hypothetical protein